VAPPTLETSEIFLDTTLPQPHLYRVAAEIAAIRRLYIGLRVRYRYYKKRRRFGLAWNRPCADRGLNWATGVLGAT